MLQTYEALLEPDGHLQFLETPPRLANQSRRVLVTFTMPTPEITAETKDWQDLAGSIKNPPWPLNETALLAQPALTDDWLNPEEDAAWAHLQPAK